MSAPIEQTAGAANLSPDERLVLWGMRTWTAAIKAEVPVAPMLTRAFATLDAEAAVPTLDGVMALLHSTGLHAFHHPACRCLGDEERLLLDVLAAHQRGDDATALFLARLLLPPGGVRLLGAGLHTLAMALLACGIRLTAGGRRQTVAAGALPRILAPSSTSLH